MERLDYDINVDCIECNIQPFMDELDDMGEAYTIDIDPFGTGCFTIRKPKQSTVEYIKTLEDNCIYIIS